MLMKRVDLCPSPEYNTHELSPISAEVKECWSRSGTPVRFLVNWDFQSHIWLNSVYSNTSWAQWKLQDPIGIIPARYFTWSKIQSSTKNGSSRQQGTRAQKKDLPSCAGRWSRYVSMKVGWFIIGEDIIQEILSDPLGSSLLNAYGPVSTRKLVTNTMSDSI